MESQFSEFTYGYTLVEELSRHTNFSAVPMFPTLVQEGREGGGYDVSLVISGMPIFLQFKRSDYLLRSNAKYYNLFGRGYYRFDLHALKYSQQHNLLLQLERSGSPVFYVAPKFYKESELHQHYYSSTIVSNSIWIEPINIGNLPDDKKHSICFNKSATAVYFCSEPQRIKPSISSGSDNVKFETEQLRDFDRYFEEFQSREENKKYDKEDWSELYNQLEYILGTHDIRGKRVLEQIQKEDNIIFKTAKLARIGFGLEMMIFNKS